MFPLNLGKFYAFVGFYSRNEFIWGGKSGRPLNTSILKVYYVANNVNSK